MEKELVERFTSNKDQLENKFAKIMGGLWDINGKKIMNLWGT